MPIPSGDRIIVEKIETEKKTEGGIIIPDTVSNASINGNFTMATVKEIPAQHPVCFFDISKGDTVYYLNGSGIEFEFNGKKQVLLRIGEVQMIEKNG